MTKAASAKKSIDSNTLKRLAIDASVDPRTMQAVFEGRYVRGMAGERAKAALVAAGLLPTTSNGVEK